MTAPERGVLDTSVIIARESGRSVAVDRLPELMAVTVITEAEIRSGVLSASDAQTRAVRLRTLQGIARLVVLPADSAAAEQWARLRGYLEEHGRRRVRVNDLWIAAIATAHGLPVVTQDDDFDALADAPGVQIIKV